MENQDSQNPEVIEVTENEEVGEIISDNETPSFQKFKFKAYSDKFFSPGSIVAIKIDDKKYLIGRITYSHEVNPNYTPERVAVRHSMNIPSEHPGEDMSISIFRIYDVEIISQIKKVNDTIVIFPPEVLPKAGWKVIVPEDKMIAEVLGIKNDIKDGLHLGNLATTLSSESNIPLVLKKEIIQRHVFIGGTTGGGKSYSARVIAEELHKHGLPIIFFDTQQEFTMLTRGLNGEILQPGNNYSIRLSSLTEDEVLDLVPSVHHKLHLEILSAAFIRAKENGSDFDVDGLLATIEEVAKEQSTSPNTIKIITQRVKSYLKSYNFLGKNFDWVNTFKNTDVFNIDCHKETRHRLQLILAGTLRELQKLRLDKKIPPYAMIIDEAHLFVPDGEDSACKQIIRENVRMGRHHGICMVLITQSPIDIDKKAIRQCNTRFLFALEPDQLAALQGVKADATREMIDKLPKSPVGTCLLSGTYETVKHALPLAIRKLNTNNADSGKTPPIFEMVQEFNQN